jgi:hypothetical protein
MHARRLLVTLVTQVTAIVVLRLRLALDFLLAFTPAFFLPSTCMMSSCCNIPVALACNHAPFVILAVV